MRATIRSLICLVLLGATSAPAGAQTTVPHATDVAGDANGILTPMWNGGLVGFLIEQVTGDRDPLGPGTPSPVSEDQADLRSLTFATDHIAVPVGDDGIDYRATGLSIRFTTTSPPFGDPALRFGVKLFIAPPEGEICRAGVSGFVGQMEEWVDGSARFTGEVDAWGSLCPPNRSAPEPRWTTRVNGASNTITITFPFDSLTSAERNLLGVGAVIYGARGFTAPSLFSVGYLDATPTAEPFEVGSDVPPDVPCTSGCPG